MGASYEEPEKCDEISEMILSALYKRNRATTTTLREMTGVESSSIRYRIDEYLEPADLVRSIGTKDHPGEDVRRYEITGDGGRYVSDQWGDMMHYAQRHEVLDAAAETHQRLDLLDQRIDDHAQQQDNFRETINRRLDGQDDEISAFKQEFDGKYGSLEARVSDLEDEIDDLERVDRDQRHRIDQLEDVVDGVGTELENITRRLDRVHQIAEEAWARACRLEYEFDGIAHILSAGKNEVKVLVTNYGVGQLRDWQR